MAPRVTLAAIAATLVFTSCSTLRSWFGPPRMSEPPPPPAPEVALPWPDPDAGTASPPVWLEGPLLRAASVALGDLVQRAGANPRDPLVVCLSRPDAYDVQVIREAPDRWFLYVRPRIDRCLDLGGASLKGGDATYEISKEGFRILGAELGE